MRLSSLIFSFTTLCVLAVSCKKDEPAALPIIPDPVDPASIDDYSLMQNGNYWIYERHNVDTTGTISSGVIRNDTIIVVGDSVIDGVAWKVLYTTFNLTQNRTIIQRNSAEFLLRGGPWAKTHR